MDFFGLGLDGHVLLAVWAITLGAAIVRGYSGFGFSALFVLGASLVLPPSVAVPIALLLEVAASLILIRHVREALDWRMLGWLTAGSLIGGPIGTLLLSRVPDDPMRLGTAAVVMAIAMLLWSGRVPRLPASAAWCGAVGVVSGLLNGAAAVGGLPVVLFALAARLDPASARALLIVYILQLDVVAVALAAGGGLIDGRVGVLAMGALIPLLIGLSVGNRRFSAASPESVRRWTFLLLVILAVAGMARSLLVLESF